jgi:ABC-type uncharacterized transport system permease subunit
VTLVLLILVAAIYLAASLLYLNLLLSRSARAGDLARSALTSGFVLHTLAFVAIHTGNPVTGTPVQDSVSFMAYAVVGLWLVFQHRFHVKVLGALLSPLAFLLVFYATLPIGAPAPPESLRSLWPHFHILLSVIGFAFLAVAFAAGVVYLVQDRELKSRRTDAIERVVFRLPPLEVLDRLNTLCLLYGFPILTLGMIMGMLWESGRSGRFAWGPHVTLSIAAWAIYLAIVASRILGHQRGRRAALLSVLGFIALSTSYLGVRALGWGS